VRRLCTQCARPHAVPRNIEAEAAVFAHKVLPGMAPRWMEAVGCPNCMNTGYRGRLGIYEMVPVSEAMQHLIVSGASVNEMKKLARDEGHRFLRDDGLLKAWQGLTTVEEVLRVAGT
jgi:general secretion pathway protein E